MSGPVNVSNDEESTDYFSNIVNLWREWSWQGGEPLNRRLNNFVSLILLNQIYNITYRGTNPLDTIHRIGQRMENGEADKFIIIKY